MPSPPSTVCIDGRDSVGDTSTAPVRPATSEGIESTSYAGLLRSMAGYCHYRTHGIMADVRVRIGVPHLRKCVVQTWP